MSFFSFVMNRVIYLDGNISLPHVLHTHLSKVIKSQNKIYLLLSSSQFMRHKLAVLSFNLPISSRQ
jgi:hypothetical protein